MEEHWSSHLSARRSQNQPDSTASIKETLQEFPADQLILGPLRAVNIHSCEVWGQGYQLPHILSLDLIGHPGAARAF